jgi:chemotaxis protein MotB
MAMKMRRHSSPDNHDRWLVSYADFVTLLFAFFVVLYATAQVDRQRAVRLSDAIRSAFQELGVFQNDGPKPNTLPQHLPMATMGATPTTAPLVPVDDAVRKEQFNAIRNELESALADEIKRSDVALHMEADGLVVSLREMGFFDSGSASIKPGAESAFGRVAHILREHSCMVRIEGHTDNVPIHTSQFASNWELSTARATGLVRLLIEQYDISAGQLSAAGYAEFHPVSANDNAKGRQLNRRVDVVILRSGLPQAARQEHAANANMEPITGP